MADNGKEDQELQQIWKLFQDSPEEIKERRQQITKIIHEDQNAEFPTSISIVTAFDELLSCFALGGQLKNYYRYGTMDVCQRQREKFWFAIKMGNFSEDKDDVPVESLTPKQLATRSKIQDFYKKRLLEDKANGSSEDIWNKRTELLSNPFEKSK
ncbi:uncharacterized protein RJT20DRAFT_28368 [Scheffersomyces xylosifermentans]|uniref:uncharacterized protein n=1 Tax=Scheffersomyces xylosifermentans TaxID=1304137 RepID=UPI00315DE81F